MNLVIKLCPWIPELNDKAFGKRPMMVTVITVSLTRACTPDLVSNPIPVTDKITKFKTPPANCQWNDPGT